jgi:hypothetical protein
MKQETKFKLKTYLLYLILEPWSERVTLPNFSTIVWILILLSIIFKVVILLWISIIFGIIFSVIKEWKSGKFIYWYRMKKYKNYKKENKQPDQKTSVYC